MINDAAVCDGHYEHDWEVIDERDGERALNCKRCGAEAFEKVEDDV